MTAFAIGLSAAFMWVGVIVAWADFMRKSPGPPVKSIRRFSRSRQALKEEREIEARSAGTEPRPDADEIQTKRARGRKSSAEQPEEDIDFPLGPRLMRQPRSGGRGRKSGPTWDLSDPGAEVSVHRSRPPLLDDDAGDDEADEEFVRPIRPDAEPVRDEADQRKGGEGEAKGDKAVPKPKDKAGPESDKAGPESREAQAERPSAGPAADPETRLRIVVSEPQDLIPETSKKAEQEEPPRGKRRQPASTPKAPKAAPEAGSPQVAPATPKSRADFLGKYARKAGDLSYVLVDDDGHPIREQRTRQKS